MGLAVCLTDSPLHCLHYSLQKRAISQESHSQAAHLFPAGPDSKPTSDLYHLTMTWSESVLWVSHHDLP